MLGRCSVHVATATGPVPPGWWAPIKIRDGHTSRHYQGLSGSSKPLHRHHDSTEDQLEMDVDGGEIGCRLQQDICRRNVETEPDGQRREASEPGCTISPARCRLADRLGRWLHSVASRRRSVRPRDAMLMRVDTINVRLESSGSHLSKSLNWLLNFKQTRKRTVEPQQHI